MAPRFVDKIVQHQRQLLMIESRHLPLPSSGRAKNDRVLKSAMAVSTRQRNLPGRSSTSKSARLFVSGRFEIFLCVCELRHIAPPRIDLQRHLLPRLRPAANGGSLFEKCRPRAVADGKPVPTSGSGPRHAAYCLRLALSRIRITPVPLSATSANLNHIARQISLHKRASVCRHCGCGNRHSD